MADNIIDLKNQANTVIDPNAEVGGIIAEDHNQLLNNAFDTLGKYSGIVMTARDQPQFGAGTAPRPGEFSFNGNPMNTATDFTVSVSVTTNDFFFITEYFDLLNSGALIKFKDKAGRTALYEYISHVPIGTSHLDVVISYKSGPNYTYQAGEFLECVLEFFNVSSVGTGFVDLITNQSISGEKLFTDALTVANTATVQSLVVDENNTNTGIAESILTVKKTSTSNNTNAGVFFDVERQQTVADNIRSYGVLQRIDNKSSVQTGGVVGARNIARHSSSEGEIQLIYGAHNTASITGSGVVEFLIASLDEAEIKGGEELEVDIVRGAEITIDNTECSINAAQCLHPSFRLLNGNVSQGHVLYLDADVTGGSIGQFAYVRSGIDAGLIAAMAGNPNAYYIYSQVALPSKFAGKLTTTAPVTDITENGDYLTKEYLTSVFYEEGTYSAILGGGTYTNTSNICVYKRTGNIVNVTFNIENIDGVGAGDFTLSLPVGLPKALGSENSLISQNTYVFRTGPGGSNLSDKVKVSSTVATDTVNFVYDTQSGQENILGNIIISDLDMSDGGSTGAAIVCSITYNTNVFTV